MLLTVNADSRFYFGYQRSLADLQKRIIKKDVQSLRKEYLGSWQGTYEWVVENYFSNRKTPGVKQGPYLTIPRVRTSDYSDYPFYDPKYNKLIPTDASGKSLLNATMWTDMFLYFMDQTEAEISEGMLLAFFGDT